MAIVLDWTILQLALVVTFFIVGLTIGWGRMFIWAIGLFFAWYATDNIGGPLLEKLINKFIGFGASFIPLLTGADENSVTAPAVDIPSPDVPLWKIGFLLLVAIPVVIFVIRKWAVLGAGAYTILGRFWGGVLGALSAVFLLGKLTEYWRTWVTAEGHSDPLANFNLRLDLPTLAIGGSPGTTAFNWPQLAGLALVLILALFVGYAVWRALKAVI